MDFSLQLRSLEFLVKYLRHDMKDAVGFPYELQKQTTPTAKEPRPLERITPEEAGVSSTAAARFLEKVDEDFVHCAAHGVILLRGGKVFLEADWKPYTSSLPHMVYSMSKSVTATAIGMAVDEGLLSLDEYLVDIFPESVPSSNYHNVKDIQVKHLLIMSTGSRFNEVGSMMHPEWVRMFMETVPKFAPGTAFEYNSLNTYMLSAVLAKKTGMGLVEYLRPRLFEPLGIEEFTWEICPRGIEKGGWGLNIKLEDSAKIGQLYLNRGMWNGRRLFSEKWADAAMTAQIPTPNGESTYGYGYQIWMNSDGSSVRFSGVFGQYVVIMPKYDAVMAIYGGSACFYDQTGLMELLSELLSGADAPLAPDVEGMNMLSAVKSSLIYKPNAEADISDLGNDAEQFGRIVEALDGCEFKMTANHAGLFPQEVQAVHGNFSEGVDLIRFEKRDGVLRVSFYEGFERNDVLIGPDIYRSEAGMKRELHAVGTRALWRLAPDGIRIAIIASFLETPASRVIVMTIRNGIMKAVFDESPTLEGSITLLAGLIGFDVTKISPRLRRKNLVAIMRSFSAPTADGRLILKN